MKKFLTQLWNRLSLNLFSQGEGRCLVDPMASCCMINGILIFFSTSDLVYPDIKSRLQLIRARTIFT